MSAGHVEAPGAALAYDDAGGGAPALLVHGSALVRQAWADTAEALAGAARTIAYDRRGYGDSGAPEPYTATTVEEQAEDAAVLLRALGAAPAIVCGHGTGAVVALDLMRRHPRMLRGAVLVEPPLLSLSPLGGEALEALRQEIEEAARDGGPGAALDAFAAGQYGSGPVEALLPGHAEAVRRAGTAAFADFAAVHAWEFTRAGLGELATPAVVLRGARSGAAIRDVAATLAGLLGAARLGELDGGQGGPLEDPAGVAAAIRSLAG